MDFTASLRRTFVALVVGLGILALGCDREPRVPLSTVLITLDTTRADVLGFYGGGDDVSPELDAIAAESMVYDAAYTVAPTTHAAHTSMLTGLYPPRHHIRDNGMHPLSRSAVTLAERARDAGYDTAAFIAASVLDRSSGLDQGFALYDVPRRPASRRAASAPQRNATQIAGATLRWLEARGEDRFFLWVHFFDPHSPYRAPEIYNQRGNRYLGEVAFMSEQVGRIVDALRQSGALEDTLLLVVGDHGEAFGEHGEKRHGMLCYEPTMRIPMLIRYPEGHWKGRRSARFASSVDILPTLADAMGLDVPERLDGVSLYRQLAPRDRGLYFESFTAHVAYRWSPIAGWIDRRGKYLHSTEPEYYEIAEDPGETTNLVEERKRDIERHRAAIEEISRRPALPMSNVAIDPDSLQRLRALGYVTFGDTPSVLPDPLAETMLPAPRSMMGVHSQIQNGLSLLSAGQAEDAKFVFEAALARDPRNRLARTQLALSMIRTHDCTAAIDVLNALAKEGLERAAVYYNLGFCYREMGHPEQAITQMKRAADLDRAEPIFLRDLIALLQEHDPPEAPPYEARLRELEGAR